MQLVDRILRRICEAAGIIGVLAIFSLMLLTVVTVVFRAMHIAFPGTYAIAELLLIPAVSISLAYAAMQHEHTRAVLFVDLIKNDRLRRGIHGTVLLLGSLFWVVVAWATIREAIRRGAQNELSPIINIPVAPFRWSMAAAVALLCVILVWQGYKLLRGIPAEDEQHNLDTSA
ncbi:TRAP transporter small permease [Devosia albogilva]|uniref:TRAP transporter small permease protein n=1 Tax=Devosia albogilva TaxID=429726 RepID=A0ABW5QH84_9HYPH